MSIHDHELTPRLLEQVLKQRNDLEGVIKLLRAHGYSKVASIKVLNSLGLSLKEAKPLVHESETWSDAFERDEALHQRLEDHFLPPKLDRQ